MPEAKQLHRRTGVVANTASKAIAKKPVESEKVAVKVLPTEKHESFEDFYPLHVTKVDSASDKIGLGPILFGLILIILVAALSFWYVKQQESANPGYITPKSTQTTPAADESTDTTSTLPSETGIPAPTSQIPPETSSVPTETTTSVQTSTTSP